MEEVAKSPIQNDSIRSPMEAKSPKSYVDSPSADENKIAKPVFSPATSTKSESKSRRESSSGTAKKAKVSTEKIPAAPQTPKKDDGEKKATTTTTTEKRRKSVSATATKKKKIEELEAQEAEVKSNLEKLRRDKGNQQKRMKNLEDSLVKFPMKDELLFNPAYVKGKPRKTLPVPSSSVDQYISNDLASDTVFVWDFLNVFSKQLSLASLSFEDFSDLLKHTGRDSVALTEVFVSLLRLVVSDTAILNKLNNAVPRKVHFAYRVAPVVEGAAPPAQDVEEELNLEQLSNLDSFDNLYNGFKLLPRKVRPEHVDVIRYQAVLRCVLLRLEPVKRLRSAVVDITSALQTSLFAAYSVLGSTMKRLNTANSLNNVSDSLKNSRNNSVNSLHASSSVNSLTRYDTASSTSSASQLPPKTPMNVKFSNLLHRIDTSTSVTEGRGKVAAAKKVSEITSAAMARVNTPRKANSLKTAGLDKDAIFRISSDVTAPLETVVEAAIQMETKEMFELSAKHKLAVLKVLCEACFDTVRITELLERNAEERATQIAAQTKAIREAKLKLRELSVGKRAQAVEICKKANKAAVEAANAAALASLGVTSSKSRKSLSKTPSTSTDSVTAAAAAAPKKRGGPMAKELYEPSQEQINAMIDDLVLIETLGIDEVVDDFLPEVISDDEDEAEEGGAVADGNGDNEEDDYEMVDGDYIRMKRPRRNAAKRAQGGERRRQKEEKRYRNETFEIADHRLNAAIERNSERDIRAAVKHGEKAGLRFSDKKGRVFCTQKLKQAYKILSEMETQTADDRANNQHERALQEFFVRTQPIGSDRFHNQYWSFVGDERLFVQQREEVPEKDRTGLIPPTSGPHHDKTLTKLFASRPNRYTYKWVVYSSVTEFWYLWDALDERGEREAGLKAASKARFDFSEPETVYMQIGSEYLGRKVTRNFGKKKSVVGTIVGWLPQSGEDLELYHIVHADGDEEDLELHEVLEYLIKDDEPKAVTAAVAATSSLLSPERGSAGEGNGLVRSSSRSSLRGSSSSSNVMDLTSPVKGSTSAASAIYNESKGNVDGEAEFNDEDEEEEGGEEEVPSIITRQTNITRGNVNRLHNIGVAGLRADLNKTLCDSSEVLKRLGGMFARDARKAWESQIRNAESALELREPLLELETLVRGVQKAEDKRDVEELRLQREKKYADMRDEGWIFEQLPAPPSTSDTTSKSESNAESDPSQPPQSDPVVAAVVDYSVETSLIGTSARRFFKGFGKSDGKIVAFLPGDKNEGLSLYHMEHTDGDVEDLDEIDVQRGIRHFESGCDEDDEVRTGGEGEGEEEEGDDSDDEGENEEEEESEYVPVASAANVANGIYSLTLWPTHEIRLRWRDCVNNIRTVGELALALTAFVEQVKLFGVIVPNEEEVRAATARSSKLRAVSSSSSSRGASSSSNSRSGGGASETLGKRIRTSTSSSRNQHFSPEKRARSQRSSARQRINYNEDY